MVGRFLMQLKRYLLSMHASMHRSNSKVKYVPDNGILVILIYLSICKVYLIWLQCKIINL